MKEIGEQLKQAREAIGISIEEAAEDLKLKPSQLINVEEGNKEALKDVYNLKDFIKNYAKYLGLEPEKIEDRFNEFIFEYTSKIPLNAINKANQEKKKEETKKVVSPYTLEPEKKIGFSKILIGLLIIVGLIVGYLIYDNINDSSALIDNNNVLIIS